LGELECMDREINDFIINYKATANYAIVCMQL
jgi:hypothetical protein